VPDGGENDDSGGLRFFEFVEEAQGEHKVSRKEVKTWEWLLRMHRKIDMKRRLTIYLSFTLWTLTPCG
jgi:hypothetical protein